jgi:hypothetical protein
MRNVLMVFVFFSYCSLLLTAQALGSYMYCGTVLIENMMGATSIEAFHAPDGRYICMHAHSHSIDEKHGNKEIWKKDKAPVVCHLESFTLGGMVKIEEFGRADKEDESEFISEHMDLWTGVWKDNFFGIENSFLKDSIDTPGGSLNFESPTWKDPHNWLVKCSVAEEDDEDKDEWAGKLLDEGKGDNLCWRLCEEEVTAPDGTNSSETEECWIKDVKPNSEPTRRRLDDDDDDDDEEFDSAKPTLYPKFNCKGWGTRKMRAVTLVSMVLMEFTMLYAFSKYEFGPPLVFTNMSFPMAWVPMLIGLFTFVYFPVSIWDNEFAPLDAGGLLVAILIAATFYLAFEAIKVLNRQWFAEELQNKMAVAQLSAEGKLKAYAGVSQARSEYPARVPLIQAAGVEVEMQAA